MFEVEYKGGNGVVISSSKATVVADPKLSVVGLKDLAVKEKIELATEERFAINASDASIVIEGPGEYGIADLDIKGIAATRHLDTEADPKRSTIYRIDNGEIRLALVGNVFEKINEDQLEAIGIVDILIIPVGGGGYTLDATGAAALVRKIDPKVVVPIHYEDGALKYEVPQAPLSEFIEKLGAPVEDVAKLKFKNAAALPANLTVFSLARS